MRLQVSSRAVRWSKLLEVMPKSFIMSAPQRDDTPTAALLRDIRLAYNVASTPSGHNLNTGTGTVTAARTTSSQGGISELNPHAQPCKARLLMICGCSNNHELGTQSACVPSAFVRQTSSLTLDANLF